MDISLFLDFSPKDVTCNRLLEIVSVLSLLISWAIEKLLILTTYGNLCAVIFKSFHEEYLVPHRILSSFTLRSAWILGWSGVSFEGFRPRLHLSCDLLEIEVVGLDCILVGVEGALEGKGFLDKHFVLHDVISHNLLQLCDVLTHLCSQSFLLSDFSLLGFLLHSLYLFCRLYLNFV